MSIIEYKNTCALCGLAVEIDGFTLRKNDEELKFCCAGCLSIYELINPIQPIHQSPIYHNNNHEDNK